MDPSRNDDARENLKDTKDDDKGTSTTDSSEPPANAKKRKEWSESLSEEAKIEQRKAANRRSASESRNRRKVL